MHFLFLSVQYGYFFVSLSPELCPLTTGGFLKGTNVGKLEKYKIDLKGMRTDTCQYEFLLDNQFFADVDGSEVQKGKVHVALAVKRTSRAYELNFQTSGVVWVPCDRCLDDMEQPITSVDKLIVKFGEEYAEEDDNLVVIPETEGVINVTWFMYEFIALAIPMKHVHAPGKCNKEMKGKLNKHLCSTPDDEVGFSDIVSDTDMVLEEGKDAPIDPRWNELKKILDNN